MIIEKNRLTFRFSDEILEKSHELIYKYPDDFKTMAQIFRAGVMALYRERIEVKKNELLPGKISGATRRSRNDGK